MSEYEVSVEFESYPESDSRWRFTPEAVARAVADLPGTPVTWNYDLSRVIGRVVEAKIDDEGVSVRLDLDDDLTPSVVKEDGFKRLFSVSPGFVPRDSGLDELTGVVAIDRALLFELGVFATTRKERG